MYKHLVMVGLLLVASGSASAQISSEFPKLEASPDFMYIHNTTNLGNFFYVSQPITTPVQLTGKNSFNCAGGGGTVTYNLRSYLGIAMDLDGCKFFGDTLGLGNTASGNQFTYLFGPRVTFRTPSRFVPFFLLEFGGDRVSLSCNNSGNNCSTVSGSHSISRNVFAMTVGGGFDWRINRRFSVRPIDAEYLYTNFGNGCVSTTTTPTCGSNNHQNAFRMKSGVVFAFGGSASK